MIRKLYPYGKKKAFNVTYDDGVLQDIRFVELLNQYQLKGTFNLNSLLLETEYEWTHESGCVVKRLKTEDVRALYTGHEIASHTLTHPYMHNLSKEEILYELSMDKVNLERIFSKEIKGFAVPFDYYSELIEICVKECGFEYARISEESYSFCPQNDFYKWRATIFHCDDKLEGLVQQFVETDEELAMFQIVGHTYDLDVENKWDTIEAVFKEISKQNDILPMTTIEIIDYLKAMNKVEITDKYIQNNSDISLWFSIDNIICEVKTNEKVFCNEVGNNGMNNLDYVFSSEEGNILIEKDSKRITDDIVDQLVAYRKQLKLTQQDIADATGIKRANIARLELKKNEASLDSLVRYAKCMGLDVAVELVGIQENTVREES